MKCDFKNGDPVKLKTGSPIMIIEEIVESGGTIKRLHVRCVWFDGKKHKVGLFSPHVLELTKIEKE